MNKHDLLKFLKQKNNDRKIIDAFQKVRRENFIPEQYLENAYENIPIPIGYSATTSQPQVIAFMLELLELDKGQKILEIGSGSGYVLALLAEITNGNIYGIEIVKELSESSKTALSKYKNVHVLTQNGAYGLKKHAPFDRILVSAAASEIPMHLAEQLSPKGIIVSSVKDFIIKIKKENDKINKVEYPGFAFVPLKYSN